MYSPLLADFLCYDNQVLKNIKVFKTLKEAMKPINWFYKPITKSIPDMLKIFEENYPNKSKSVKISILISVVCILTILSFLI